MSSLTPDGKGLFGLGVQLNIYPFPDAFFLLLLLPFVIISFSYEYNLILIKPYKIFW